MWFATIAALLCCVMADAGGVARVKMNGCAALATPPLPLPFITHQGSDGRGSSIKKQKENIMTTQSKKLRTMSIPSAQAQNRVAISGQK